MTASAGTAGPRGLTVALVCLDPDERLGQLAAALARAGHRPLLVTADDGHPTTAAGGHPTTTAGGFRYRNAAAGPTRMRELSPARELSRAGSYFEEFTAGLDGVLASAAPDVVHTVGWAAGLSARLIDRDLPRVHSFRAPAGSQLHPGRFRDDRRRVERAAVSGARRVLVDSGPGRDIVRRLGVPPDTISVVPPGVDLDVFHPPAAATARRTSGRLVLAAHDLDRFTLRAVLRAAPEAELVLLETAGGAPDTGSAFAAAVLREGARNRVRVEPAVDSAHRASVLRSADLLLYRDAPEHARSLPMEAMACGVPLLACCPESVDAMVPGVSGVDAVGQSPDELGRTVRRLLADPVTWQAMSFGAIDRAGSRYGWSRVAAETARVYGESSVPRPVRSPGR